jgi:hypothetical protein
MTVKNSALKCKDGDFAVVVFDTPGCSQNIGRVVQVRGPVRRLKQSGKLGWLIKPIHKEFEGLRLDGRIVKELVFGKLGTSSGCLVDADQAQIARRWHEALLRFSKV